VFDVFIEGSRDPSPEGRARLAAAIAEKFGMPRDRIEQGLATGRVRAKAGADAEMAQGLKTQLEALGAIVGLVDTAAAKPLPAKPPPTPKPPPPSRPSGNYESGLKAAFDTRSTGQNAAIAALDRIALAPQESISLSSLDGSDVGLKAAAPVAVEPSSSARNLFAPPSDTEEPQLELARPSARNLFAPPSGTEEPQLELARPSARTPTTPPAQRPAPTPRPEPQPPPQPSRPVPRVTVPPGPPPQVAPEPQALDADRKRWLIGLALGILVGFFVAHLWGLHAEGRYDAMRADAVAGGVPENDEEYTLALERHEIATVALARAHSRARLTAGFLWLIAGGGVAFAWNRYGKPRD
jgi:hypothetical protein